MKHMIAAAAMMAMVFSACAQENLAVLEARPGQPAPGEMLYTSLQRDVDAALDRRQDRYGQLKTADDVAACQQELKAFFIEQLGGFPERTPLNARTVATLDRDGYRIEKVMFESRPGFHVTGLLHLPVTPGPHPAVLVPCGHSANGKASEAYQTGSILMARNGVAAFCFDPFGQGERYQVLSEDGKPRHSTTTEHTLAGAGCILLGLNAATYEIWDGMRAIDYLQSREDIDPKRIGCAGNSGGGTQTAYFMALDDRIQCAAPSCYITSLRRLTDTIGPQDAEQNIHGQIARGMDHADYIIMRAPKPTLLCCATRDFFDIQGAWDSFRQAKRVYTRLGLPEGVDLVETDEEHGWTAELRSGTARWMRRWLLNTNAPLTGQECVILTDEEAQCTEQGQVLLLDGARSVYDLNAEIEAGYAAGRAALWSGDAAAALARVREIADIRPLDQVPACTVETLGTIDRGGYRIEKQVFVPSEGIVVPALRFVPAQPVGAVCLYAHGGGKQAEAAPGGAIEALVKQGLTVVAVDLPGLGETTSAKDPKGGFSKRFSPNWKEFFLAYKLDRSLLGMRAESLLMLARALGGTVQVAGVGEAGPAVLHAAALEPALFASVRLEHSLDTWTSIVTTREHTLQLANCVHGALRVYDLPDLVASLGDQIAVVHPVNAMGN
ncbi:MAG TPA: acetylxylan esterase [Candidatus Hydrogenedentes bacterium]|jgi:dienelactone hydrolase|nr:acetylxylan esterase [FCB group bacterium]HNV21893.1 acetylxylan esterase [Candidatus Hydrogenedentota bacterium]HNZ18134.1 acetylxylan esterase [Candidatus Hydrogenedentota bacterium]HOH32424.1 acetylxylan esterase [Candidatus Hydrogenedentota bacterium]HPA05326.1 acetylxylan esterase [Candidatus Hydrogenedentota bacterium]